MRDLIEQFVRFMLQPYLDRIEELSAEVEDLRRRTQSMIRLGVVDQVNDKGTRIRVKHGELVTPFVKWFAPAAGETIDYRCPSKGEQALLLNYGAGNAGAQVVALVGLFSTKFPSPSTDPNEILRVYPDGTRVSYHADDHRLTVDVKGEVKVLATGKAMVDAKTIHLNGTDGQVVTTCHVCHFIGSPHEDGSSTVSAGK